MSEQAPEAGRAGPKDDGLTGLLTRKVGGFPVWVYVAVLAGLLGWRYVASRKAASAGTSGTSGAASGSTTDTTGTSTMTDASQVPQFVNQTYTSLVAPSAPGSTMPRPPTPRPVPKVAQFPKPTGLRATNATKNGVTLTWNTTAAVGGIYPESYTVEVFNAKGRPVSTSTVDTPDAVKGQGTTTLVGLPSGQHLHANVWPNGGQHAPQNASVPFQTAA